MFKGKSIRSYLFPPLIFVFSYLIGEALVSSPGYSLGGWLRNLFPAFSVGLILAFLMTVEDVRPFFVPSASGPWVSRQQLFFSIAVSLVVGMGVVLCGPWGLTLFSFVLGVVALFLVSMFFVLSGKLLYGLVVFTMILAPLAFLEHEFKDLVWKILVQGPFYVTPSIILLCVFSIALAGRLRLSRQRLVRTSLDKYILLFLLPLFVSSIISSDPSESFRSFFSIICALLGFLLVVNCLRFQEDVVPVLLALVAWSCMRFLSVYYFSLKQNIGLGELYQRVEQFIFLLGTLNVSGIFAISILMALSLYYRRTVRGLLFGFMAFGFIVMMLLFLSRSAVLSSIGTVSIFLLTKEGRKRAIPFMVLMVLSLVVFWPLFFASAFGRLSEFYSVKGLIEDQTMRIDGWSSAIRMIRDHPVLGIGPGMWLSYIPLYTQKVFIWAGGKEVHISFAHNIFLHYGSAGGIGALVATMVLFGAVFKKGISLCRAMQDSSMYPLALGLLASLVGYSIYASVGGSVFETPMSLDRGMYFWIITGLIFTLHRAPKRRKTVVSP